MSSYLLETHCLGVLLRRPDLLNKVDRRMQEDALPRLAPEDFQHADHQSILELFQEAVDQDMAEPLNFVFAGLSLPLMELADGLLERTTRLDPNDERVMEDLMRGLLELRLRNLHQNIDYLRYQMEEAQGQGDTRASAFGQAMMDNTVMLKRLNRALARYTSHSVPVR
jgi:hypothetical protein